MEELIETLKQRGIEVIRKKEKAPPAAAQLMMTEKVTIRRFDGEKGEKDGATTN